MSLRIATCAAALALSAAAAAAATLEFPAHAVPTAEHSSALDSHTLPVSAFRDGQMDRITAEGVLHQQAWRVGSGGLTTLQILAPLRQQLLAEGYEVLFECESEACGGFDFRFQTPVLPEPEMHIDLGDFRYLALRRNGEEQDSFVSIIVSRSTRAGFAQITRIGPRSEELVLTGSTKTPAAIQPLPVDTGPFIEQLRNAGRATLDDLTFKTGSSELGDGDFLTLAELSAFLISAPDQKVVLVGHTDAEGALDSNIALSRRRAQAVADRLIAVYGVSAAQIAAEGVGFLAPRDTNQTDVGRTRNRRVEVVLATIK